MRWISGISAVCLLGACASDSGDSGHDTSAGIGDGDGDGAGDGDGDGTGDGDGDGDGSGDGDGDGDGTNAKWDTLHVPDASDDCVEGGEGESSFTYIWIANSSEGTVSKINTETGVEEGRYDSTPEVGGNPSRTSVNLLGDVAVSNRDPGGITKIAAQIENCVDKNNDNVITTSTGPNDVLPWGEDECVLWHTNIDSNSYGNGPRPTAWEGGKFNEEDCTVDTNPRLWIGYKDGNNDGIFMRLDGETGEILDTINVGHWGTSYGPYGGAVNADGDLIATGLNTDPSIHIDAETLEVTFLGAPVGCKYGMGLDQTGDIWAGACFGEGIHHYDFDTNTWTTIPDSGGTRVNGVQVDRDGSVWGAGSSACRLVRMDVETQTWIDNNIPLPGCSNPWGISIDVDGFVWVVDMSANLAFKVNPDTYEVEITVSGLNNPYTYSDMTGSGLNLVVNPPG